MTQLMQQQEAQLSQRDCTVLCVIEYITTGKSFKVIRSNTRELGFCKYLLVIHCNSVCCTVSEIFSVIVATCKLETVDKLSNGAIFNYLERP